MTEQEERERQESCDHAWEWMDDWMGDPTVYNGTQDLSRWECGKCGLQSNNFRSDPPQ